MKRSTIFLLWLCFFLHYVSGAPAAEQSEHILGANDVIEVRVFQEADLDSKVTLGQDGKASLPLIGEVSLAGLTINAASQAIAQKYKQGYLVNPNVTVAIASYAKKRFTVLGAVNKPGSFFFPDGESLSLLQAIGMAGSYSKVANPSKVIIRRTSAKEPIKLNAKKMANEGKADGFMIQPGDVITIDESTF